MVGEQYQITLTVKDIDNSTNLNGATVEIFDVNTQKRISTTTNSSGQATLDIAHLTGGYTNGDKLIVSAYTTDGNLKSVDYIFTLDTATYPDGFDIGTIAVMIGEKLFNSNVNSKYEINAYSISNSDASIRYVDLYDRILGNLVMRVYVPVTGTTTWSSGVKYGVSFGGGIAKVPSANGKIMPTIVT